MSLFPARIEITVEAGEWEVRRRTAPGGAPVRVA